MTDDLLAAVMAGGAGSRLRPLTNGRAKPAVPFGGIYRIIDFALSNCLNSGVRRIWVLTQYKSHSLSGHLKGGWNMLSPRLGQFIGEIPAQMQQGSHWYEGTADAIRQNLSIFASSAPEHLLVLAGDHVYKMDYRQLRRFHVDVGAVATVATVRVPAREAAGRYGVLEVDEDWRVVGFQEKPDEPVTLPGTSDCLASMGIYIFDFAVLESCLEDHADFGHHVIPAMIEACQPVYAWDFSTRNAIVEAEYRARSGYRERVPVPRSSDSDYWRDVGTLEDYWASNLDLVSYAPRFNLYGERWPILNFPMHFPPTKLIHDSPGRRGIAVNSILSDGVIVSGATIRDSLLGPGVYVHSYATVERSVLFGGAVRGGRIQETTIGRGCRVRNAILDRSVLLEEGTELGWDRSADEARGLVTCPIQDGDDHLVVVPKGARL